MPITGLLLLLLNTGMSSTITGSTWPSTRPVFSTFSTWPWSGTHTNNWVIKTGSLGQTSHRVKQLTQFGQQAKFRQVWMYYCRVPLGSETRISQLISESEIGVLAEFRVSHLEIRHFRLQWNEEIGVLAEFRVSHLEIRHFRLQWNDISYWETRKYEFPSSMERSMHRELYTEVLVALWWTLLHTLRADATRYTFTRSRCQHFCAWNDVMAAILKVWRQIENRFDPIWNDRALGCFVQRRSNKNKKKKNKKKKNKISKMSIVIWDQFPIKKYWFFASFSNV